MNTMIAGAASAAALFCLFSSSTLAAEQTLGPYNDFQVVLPVDQVNGPCQPASYPTYSVNYQTNTSSYPNVTDWFTLICNHAQNYSYAERGVSYLTSGTGNFTKGDIVVTTIYGTDLNPGGSNPQITGYTPGAPEMSYDGQYMIGKSRKTYNAGSPQLVSLAELPALLGSTFDLSPFQGDPNSVVYVFQTTMKARDVGLPVTGNLFTENFADTWHVGAGNFGGSFGPGGTLPGTLFTVTSGDVDILGVINGTNGSCVANPAGNCLDLIGNEGIGAVQSVPAFDLDPQYTYTVQFTVVAQDVKSDLHFTVALGSANWDVVATSKKKTFRLSFTPTTLEYSQPLSFTSVTNVDNQHGPVLSAIALCAHHVGSPERCSKTQ